MTPIERFWDLLDGTYPQIQNCWDRERKSMHVEQLDNFTGVASSGERHMALFFRDVWKGRGSEDNPFDLVQAIGTVDREQAMLIMKWISDPFWP